MHRNQAEICALSSESVIAGPPRAGFRLRYWSRAVVLRRTPRDGLTAALRAGGRRQWEDSALGSFRLTTDLNVTNEFCRVAAIPIRCAFVPELPLQRRLDGVPEEIDPLIRLECR